MTGIGWDVRRALSPALQGQTYGNAAFLTTRLPLGLLYFTVLFTLLGAGLSLLWALVGVLFLALIFPVAWGLASFERDLARWWLGADVPPMSLPRPPGLSLWRRLRDHLRSSVTWKSLVYLVLQLPAGAVAFLLLALPTGVGAALVLAPVLYLADALTVPAGGARFEGVLLAATGAGAGLEPRGALISLLLAAGGLSFLVLTAHAVNLAGAAWAAAATHMLGMSDSELRLAEARSQAAAEHARAERADQRRRELIVNISHELRTPVASIRGHVESLTMPEGPNAIGADAVRYLAVIQRETERLGALVDDLVAVARAESGELRLVIGPVPIAEVVEQVHSALGPIARRERSVSIVKSMPAEPLPPALADRDRLVQVLMNLVRNAVAYTAEGGIVSIDGVPAGADRVGIRVSDTGSGIPPEELPRVFERFYRTDASRARSTGGFGLGLSIARDLIEAMGGTITAESTVGVGSRFTVLLRRASGDAP